MEFLLLKQMLIPFPCNFDTYLQLLKTIDVFVNVSECHVTL